MKRPPKAVSAYMAGIGKKGGETKGPAKRRSKEHYARMVAARKAKAVRNRDKNG